MILRNVLSQFFLVKSFKVQCIISDYLVLSQVILKLQESQLPSDDKLTQYFIKYVKIHLTVSPREAFLFTLNYLMNVK